MAGNIGTLVLLLVMAFSGPDQLLVHCTDLIVSGPSTVTVPVNSYTDGVFTCTAIADAVIEWRINARGLTDLSFTSISIISLNNFGIIRTFESVTNRSSISQVRVEGVVQNNSTRLWCRAFSTLNGTAVVDSSDLADYLLYGPPDPPAGIRVTPSSHLSLLVSWDPPFFPFAEVPFTYTLFIMKNGAARETIYNISSITTSYLYAGGPSDGCRNVSFSLQSINDAGEGDVSDIVTATLPQVAGRVVNATANVEVNQSSGGNTVLMLTFESPLVCEDYPVLYYSVNLVDVTDEATPFTNTSTVDQFTTNGGMVELELEEGIEPDRVYRLTVAAVNEVGAADDSNEVEFRTTDLQSLEVVFSSEGVIELTCTFIRGSAAGGCTVDVRLTTPIGDSHIGVIIHRDRGERVVSQGISGRGFTGTAVSHQLSVTGYDYESDGSIGVVPVEADILMINEHTPAITTGTSSVTRSHGAGSIPSSTPLSASSPTSLHSSPCPSPLPNYSQFTTCIKSHSVILTIAVGSTASVMVVIILLILAVGCCVFVSRRSINTKTADNNATEGVSVGYGSVEVDRHRPTKRKISSVMNPFYQSIATITATTAADQQGRTVSADEHNGRAARLHLQLDITSDRGNCNPGDDSQHDYENVTDL